MKRAEHLDRIDRKILTLLQKDATLSYVALGERVGASSASVWRRIKALEAAGVFGATVRLVDPASVGLGVNVFCNVRMKSQQGREAFETFIDGRPEILECFSMSGEWDYLLRVLVGDVEAFNRFLMDVMLGHPSVASTASNFALATAKHTTAIPI